MHWASHDFDSKFLKPCLEWQSKHRHWERSRGLSTHLQNLFGKPAIWILYVERLFPSSFSNTWWYIYDEAWFTNRWKGLPQFLTHVSMTMSVNKVVLWLFPTEFCSLRRWWDCGNISRASTIIDSRKLSILLTMDIILPSLYSSDSLCWAVLVGIDDVTDLMMSRWFPLVGIILKQW